jgi:hypothetical protein
VFFVHPFGCQSANLELGFSRIEQPCHPLACGHFSLGAKFFLLLCPAARMGHGQPGVQFVEEALEEFFLGCHFGERM